MEEGMEGRERKGECACSAPVGKATGGKWPLASQPYLLHGPLTLLPRTAGARQLKPHALKSTGLSGEERNETSENTHTSSKTRAYFGRTTSESILMRKFGYAKPPHAFESTRLSGEVSKCHLGEHPN